MTEPTDEDKDELDERKIITDAIRALVGELDPAILTDTTKCKDRCMNGILALQVDHSTFTDVVSIFLSELDNRRDVRQMYLPMIISQIFARSTVADKDITFRQWVDACESCDKCKVDEWSDKDRAEAVIWFDVMHRIEPSTIEINSRWKFCFAPYLWSRIQRSPRERTTDRGYAMELISQPRIQVYLSRIGFSEKRSVEDAILAFVDSMSVFCHKVDGNEPVHYAINDATCAPILPSTLETKTRSSSLPEIGQQQQQRNSRKTKRADYESDAKTMTVNHDRYVFARTLGECQMQCNVVPRTLTPTRRRESISSAIQRIIQSRQQQLPQ